MRKASGLTLIELMVALAVVAVLGLLSYRAVAAATESRARLAVEQQRWNDIVRFVRMVELDLGQMVARPAAANVPADSLLLRATAGGGTELSFIMLDGARGGVRRVGYRLEGRRIALLRWPGLDAATVPAADIVLDRVADMRFTFVSAGRRTAAWPPAATIGFLPDAIELQLELADVGSVRRLVAVR